MAGTREGSFEAYVTGAGHRYAPLGVQRVRDGAIWISLPGESVVALFARG